MMIEKKIIFNATQNHIPLGGSFELTPDCNMDCRMCFLKQPFEGGLGKQQLRSVSQWTDLALQARDQGLLFLLLTGGEPFTYPGFYELYENLSSMGLILTINTNGTLITERYADLLAEHMPRRLNITLYGSTDEIYGRLCNNPNGFTQVMQAIHLLKERKVPIKLNGSLTPDNYDDLENIQKIAHELELPLEVDVYMFPCVRNGKACFDQSSRLSPQKAAKGYVKIKKDELTSDEFAELSKVMSIGYARCRNIDDSSDSENDPISYEPLPCRAGRSSFWVTWEGMMTPCVFMKEPSVPVFEIGFEAAWQEIVQSAKTLHLPNACSACQMRDYCSVCGAAVFNETGGYEQKPEYMCVYTKEKLRLMSENAVGHS